MHRPDTITGKKKTRRSGWWRIELIRIIRIDRYEADREITVNEMMIENFVLRVEVVLGGAGLVARSPSRHTVRYKFKCGGIAVRVDEMIDFRFIG